MTESDRPQADQHVDDLGISEDDGPAAAADSEVEHDPRGLDVARELTRDYLSSVAGLLPPPRGVNPRKRRPRKPVAETRSGAHPDERDPQLVGDALGRLVERRGWQTQINMHTLLSRWDELVGEAVAAHSHPESYQDQILTVRADSTAWASSLRAMAPRLVATLNQRLGHGSVLRVQVKGPTPPSWKHGIRSVRDGRGPRDTYG